MPALPSLLIEPLWDQFAVLLPPRVDTHPLGCHRPRIADRVVFDKLVEVLVLAQRTLTESPMGTTIFQSLRKAVTRIRRVAGPIFLSSHSIYREGQI